MTRPTIPSLVAASLAVAALGLSACGGKDDKKSTTTTTSKTVATTPTTLRTPTISSQASKLPGASVVPQSTAGTGTVGTTTNGLTTTSAAVARPFSADSPWNTKVNTLPLASNSSLLIQRATKRLGVIEGDTLDTVKTNSRPLNKPLFINTAVWTDPVVDSADDGVPTKITCRQINLPPPNNDCGDGWAVSTIDVPAKEAPLPQYDGWFTVLDRGKGIAYDLWRARRSSDGSSISYQFLRQWDLNGPGFLAPTVPSGRGSGLPLFAGLILPEEIRAGRIDHALAISVPGPAARNYVQPASVTDGNGDFNSLPEGARIRLKSSIDPNVLLGRNPGDYAPGKARDKLPGNTNIRAARAIITALKLYGAIVVDRAASPTLYAKLNTTWTDPLRRADGALLQADGKTLVSDTERRKANAGTPLLRGSEVEGLHLTDFEVVSLPPVRQDPPLEANLDVATARLGAVSPQQTPSLTTTLGSTGATTATTPTTSTSTATTTTGTFSAPTPTSTAGRSTSTTATSTTSTTPGVGP